MHTDQAIRQRCTEKLLSPQPLPVRDIRREIAEIVALGGLAPFHRACQEQHRRSDLDGIEPWRFYLLDAAACRRLATKLPLENAGKIPAMLSAADALILATWLPNHGGTTQDSTAEATQKSTLGDAPTMDNEAGFELTLANVEHIAAASAAIENMLLAATARGISNYWSSGGVLRLASVLEMLNVPSSERLLGAIFLFPQPTAGSELATSKLRPHRTPSERWSRWVSV